MSIPDTGVKYKIKELAHYIKKVIDDTSGVEVLDVVYYTVDSRYGATTVLWTNVQESHNIYKFCNRYLFGTVPELFYSVDNASEKRWIPKSDGVLKLALIQELLFKEE